MFCEWTGSDSLFRSSFDTLSVCKAGVVMRPFAWITASVFSYDLFGPSTWRDCLIPVECTMDIIVVGNMCVCSRSICTFLFYFQLNTALV